MRDKVRRQIVEAFGEQVAVIGPGETWTVYGSTYNPTSYTRGIALRNKGETVYLWCGDALLDSWTYPGGSHDGVPITRPGY